MCKRLSLPVAFLYLLSAFFLLNATARADDGNNNDEDEYDEHARVLRVNLLNGEVSLQRAGSDQWETAQLNTPLVEGDTLSTGRDARVEIQADSRNFIRVGENSVIRVVTLRDEGIALSLSDGSATVVLSRFDHDKEYFEVDAPKTTIAAEKTGQYRVDVDSGGVRVTVREDGRARVYSETSGFELRNNRTARLSFNDGDDGDWDLSTAAQFDDWDNWNDERGRYLASHFKLDGRERYYDADVYGAEELDAYGDWTYTNDYGYVWRPNVTVVNNYNDWAPYRYGHWDWCPPYGWTWIADEPWGWAPYHYGRWVYFNNNWCWAPRGYGYQYKRAWWRPALVAFVTIDFGGERRVCWYPLGHGQRDPRGRFWSRQTDPRTPHRRDEIDHLRPINPALLRAVTSASANQFGERHLHARPADGALAQRTLASEPVRGRLPIEPSNGSRFAGAQVNGAAPGSQTSGANGRRGLTIIRSAPVLPPHDIRERATGAATRTPGVPLDEELQRSRVFGDRMPRLAQPTYSGATHNSADNTGGVARPLAPRRPLPDAGTSEPSADAGPHTRHAGGDGRDDSTSTPHARPTRTPAQPDPVVTNGEDGRREERTRRTHTYRPESRTPMPVEGEHTQPAHHEEQPPNHHESPVPSEPTRRESAPRQETPHYEAPRHETPHQETPRQELPHRETPRQEPPHHDSPRQESPHQERPSHEDHPRDKPNGH